MCHNTNKGHEGSKMEIVLKKSKLGLYIFTLLFSYFQVLAISFIIHWIIASKKYIASIVNELNNLLPKTFFMLKCTVWGLCCEMFTKLRFVSHSKNFGNR